MPEYDSPTGTIAANKIKDFSVDKWDLQAYAPSLYAFCEKAGANYYYYDLSMEKSLASIRVGGVPEHFNMPWHWAMENKRFAQQGITIAWTDFPGGTGAMTRALRENQLDVAIVLTEGIVADILKGNPSKLVQFYVSSPLVWGIHVPANSVIQRVEELENRAFAISRKGSGSHLMAAIMAQDLNWNTTAVKYELVGNLSGARKAMATGQAYGFLWEKFTTQPYVDNGEFRRVGELPTPWPCFSIAVREDFLAKNESVIQQFLAVINQVCATWKNQENLSERIAKRYRLKVENVEKWLAITEWNSTAGIDHQALAKVVHRLHSNGIIDKMPTELGELFS